MTKRDLAIEIEAASFFATDYASAGDALAGVERTFTAPRFTLLVGRTRRFTSLVTQLHIEVCGALPQANGAASVFATCQGEIQTAHRLIGEFRDAGQVSSAHFAQSVHNTPSGLYAMATRNTAPSTTLTGANAIAAGWLEAALVARDAERPVLLSIADEPVPSALGGPPEPGGVAAAFVLRSANAGARLTIESGEGGGAGDGDGDGEPQRSLELLARLVHAVTAGAAAAITLGSVLPGGVLRLHLPQRGAS
jgi:hypothetical protein